MGKFFLHATQKKGYFIQVKNCIKTENFTNDIKNKTNEKSETVCKIFMTKITT